MQKQQMRCICHQFRFALSILEVVEIENVPSIEDSIEEVIRRSFNTGRVRHGLVNYNTSSGPAKPTYLFETPSLRTSYTETVFETRGQSLRELRSPFKRKKRGRHRGGIMKKYWLVSWLV